MKRNKKWNFVKFCNMNIGSNLYLDLKKRKKCGIINSILEKGSTKKEVHANAEYCKGSRKARVDCSRYSNR